MQVTHRLSRVLMGCVLGAFLLVGCESSPTKEDMGTVLGGVVGGLLGSTIGKGGGKTAAIVGGVVVGAMLGRALGRYMDENDRRALGEALDTTPTGQTAAWTNAETGYNFKMTPVRDYRSNEGYPCRDFVQQVIVDGEVQTVDGSACKEPETAVWESA